VFRFISEKIIESAIILFTIKTRHYYFVCDDKITEHQILVAPGSAKANGIELRSCLGRVCNFKLSRFVMYSIDWHIQALPRLELKTQPKFRPVSISLSMVAPYKFVVLR
jgi:hypothetical protein